jgi:hypothetical protein
MNAAELRAVEDADKAKLARKTDMAANKQSRLAARDAKEAARVAKEAEARAKKDAAAALAALKLVDKDEYKRLNALRRAEAKRVREEKAAAKVAAAKPETTAACGCGSTNCACGAPKPQPGDVGVDPGARNLFYVTVVKANGSHAYLRMTNGRYKTEAGIRRQARRTEAWNDDFRWDNRCVRDVETVSPKTASLAQFERHVALLTKAYGVLWSEKTKARYAKGRFDIYVRKPQALDKFLDEVTEAAGGKVARVFYGGGKWSPSAKGRESSPVGGALKRWKLRFGDKVEIVDEYLTSQCCHDCGERMCPVAHKGRTTAVRGLLCCDSSTCSVRTEVGVRGRLLNRDRQGSMNILKCGAAGAMRPKHLTRQGACGSKRTDQVKIGEAIPRVMLVREAPPAAARSTSV